VQAEMKISYFQQTVKQFRSTSDILIRIGGKLQTITCLAVESIYLEFIFSRPY